MSAVPRDVCGDISERVKVGDYIGFFLLYSVCNVSFLSCSFCTLFSGGTYVLSSCGYVVSAFPLWFEGPARKKASYVQGSEGAIHATRAVAPVRGVAYAVFSVLFEFPCANAVDLGLFAQGGSLWAS